MTARDVHAVLLEAGTALLGRHRVAVAVSEFGFLGGSIGVAAAGRLTLAVERATAERLPLIAAPASGDTGMQEGTATPPRRRRRLAGPHTSQGKR